LRKGGRERGRRRGGREREREGDGLDRKGGNLFHGAQPGE